MTNFGLQANSLQSIQAPFLVTTPTAQYGLPSSNLQVEVAAAPLKAFWATMPNSVSDHLEKEPVYWFLHPDAFQHNYLISFELVPGGGSDAQINIKEYIARMKARHADGN